MTTKMPNDMYLAVCGDRFGVVSALRGHWERDAIIASIWDRCAAFLGLTRARSRIYQEADWQEAQQWVDRQVGAHTTGGWREGATPLQIAIDLWPEPYNVKELWV